MENYIWRWSNFKPFSRSNKYAYASMCNTYLCLVLSYSYSIFIYFTYYLAHICIFSSIFLVNNFFYMLLRKKNLQVFMLSRQVREFLSGALAGAMTKAVLAPLETIRWAFFTASTFCIPNGWCYMLKLVVLTCEPNKINELMSSWKIMNCFIWCLMWWLALSVDHYNVNWSNIRKYSCHLIDINIMIFNDLVSVNVWYVSSQHRMFLELIIY